MDRSDVLLDSADVINELEKEENIKTVKNMSKILDNLWLLMLRFEEYEATEEIGKLMRSCFENEN